MHEELYAAAAKRHKQIGEDVVHDLYCQFGEDLPNVAYLRTCIKRAKPDKLQQRFEVALLPGTSEDKFDEDLYDKVLRVIEVVRSKYEQEVDTFLACKVNGTVADFSEQHGVSVSVLRKICKFVQYEILSEFYRLE